MALISKLLLKIPRLRQIKPLVNWESSRHMIPSFFIVGFQKCGTSTLYDLITSHPDVEKGIVKENNILAEKSERLDEFRLCFPLKSIGKITGDASHLHTWMPWGLERIKANFPKAKIIVIMRDPVKRAFSHFNMEQKIGYVPQDLTFDQYLDIEMVLREQIQDETNADEAYFKTKLYGNRYGWAASRGIYANYIEKLKTLEMDFLPVFMEDLATDYDLQSKRVQSYLGLRLVDIPKKVSNKGNYKVSLSSGTESRLREFYEPHNERLRELLQSPLAWK